MLYIEQPDSLAHAYGPNHQVVNDIIKELDGVTKYLHQKLKELKLSNITNVIHLSDHGMLPVTVDRVVNISQFLPPNSYYSGDSSPCFHIVPKEGK